MVETAILKKVGLSDKEINVYLTLLRSGSATAGELSKITKLHRTHVYDLLDSLEKKGLVGFIIKERRKYFQCSPPEKFLQLLKDKQEELKKSEKGIISLIGQLNKLAAYSQGRLLASIYTGIPGFKTVLDDMLNTKEDYMVLGYTQKTIKTLKHTLVTFQRKRIELKLKRRMLMSPKLKGQQTTKLPLQEIRYLPEKYHIPMGIIIYGTKVCLVIVDEDYMCILVDNKKINKNFRHFFELMWDLSSD